MISGSVGFDDWEWGVDLYADDPLVFKKLVYEMRFDEASARFGEFGPFWTGMQFSVGALGAFLDGVESPGNSARRRGSRSDSRSAEERLALGGVLADQFGRPGGCAWCGAALPPRRRTWCSDRCAEAFWNNHWWTLGAPRGQTA